MGRRRVIKPVKPELKVNPWSISPRQKEGMEMCRAKQFVLFSGPRIGGKCVSPETLVYMNGGLVPIGELGESQEDLFCDIDQRVVTLERSGLRLGTARATQFYNSGFRKAFTVSTRMNYELTCSPHHPIWSEHNGEIRFRTVSEIAELLAAGQKVWTPLARQHPRQWPMEFTTVEYKWFPGARRSEVDAATRIKKAVKAGAKTFAEISRAAHAAYQTIAKWLESPAKPEKTKIAIDDDIGYLLGVLIGDGSYPPPSSNGWSNFRFTSSDPETVEFVSRIVGTRFQNSGVRFINRYDYTINSPELTALLKHLKMSGKYAHEKEIPSVIFQSPRSVVVSLLQGLFDTDGTADMHGHCSYCTSSPKLSRQVQQLLLSLGIRASRRFKRNDYQGAWIIMPRVEDRFEDKIGFRLARKQARTSALKNKQFNKSCHSYPPSLISILRQLHGSRKERGVGELPRKTHKHVIDSVFRGNASLSRKRLEPLFGVLKCEHEPEVQKYIMGWEVWWDEVSTCAPTESHLVDLCVPETENFVANGFINHNTTGALNCAVDHAWRTDRANVAVVVVSQAGGLQSGIWKSLVRVTIPQWIDSGMGMKWERRPYIAAVSKQPACSVINAHGNISEFELHSLKHEKEVEARFKGREFTCMYVPELSNFHAVKTFSIWSECLRAQHLSDNQFLFLADTNPSDDGEDSWIYLQWFVIPKLSYEEYVELCHKRDLPIPDKDDFESYKKSVGHLTFEIADNIFLSKARISRLIRTYDGDPDLHDRYILGLWKKASADALFAKVFRPRFHIIGEIETPANQDPEIMIPNESTSRLITGMDPGAGINSAWCLMEKYHAKIVTPNGKLMEKSVFKILDELVIVGTDHNIDDYTVECVKKMEWWEERMGRRFEWEHWSDRSVFDMRDPRSSRYYHQLIHEASDGAITLRAADRAPGSVRQRISLLRKLLFEGRIFFSNDKCPQIIEMVRTIRPGSSELFPIAKNQKVKHAFDAMMYAVASEAFDEIEEVSLNRIRTSRDTEDAGLISVAT